MAISFQGAHVPPEVILRGGRWDVASPWSPRHVAALMEDRGGAVAHSTSTRWVGQDSPQRAAAFHRRQRPVWMNWRMDEPSSKVKSHWRSLARAVDQQGPTIDVLRTEHRDTAAARRWLKQAIRRHGLPATITLDGRDAQAAASTR
jgi:putative transposase